MSTTPLLDTSNLCTAGPTAEIPLNPALCAVFPVVHTPYKHYEVLLYS